MNKGNFGISQALRSRGLAQAGYMAKESNADVNRQLKGQLNRSFGKVAIQPVQDLAPPPPVMQNVGLTFMLGMGQALGEGIMGNQGLMDKWNNSKMGGGTGNTTTTTGSTGYNYSNQSQINNRFNYMSSSYQGFTNP